MVKSDVGITFLPQFTVTEELEQGSLKEIHTTVTHDQITIDLGYNKNKWISPLMDLVMSQIKEAFLTSGIPAI